MSDVFSGYHINDNDHEHPFDMLIQPVGITLPTTSDPAKTKVNQVSCGRAHTLALTDHDEIFSLGDNSHGQCGRDIVEDEDYLMNHGVIHRILGPWGQDEKVCSIVCGQDHSLFVTSLGKVYSCGWGSDGQTGLGHLNTSSEIGEIKGDIKGENIVKVSSKVDCVLALNGE